MRERTKEREGVVVSAKMVKTVVVQVAAAGARIRCMANGSGSHKRYKAARREGRMPRGRPGVVDRVAAAVQGQALAGEQDCQASRGLSGLRQRSRTD